ncbi:MAG: hypothetical protein KAJ93_08775 [Methanosarcinales archaeon]|nr:hypothetical protein [Methanosarcinales archaeon]
MGNFKPPYGSRLKLDHPLAKGLVGCWLMNERVGSKVINLINRDVGIFQNSLEWGIGGVEFDASLEHIDTGVPATNLIKPNGSIVWQFQKTNSFAIDYAYFWCIDDEYGQFSLQGESDYTIMSPHFNSESTPFVVDAALFSDGIRRDFVYTWNVDANERKLYAEGALEDTGTTAITYGAGWDAYELKIGGRETGVNRLCSGTIFYFYIYDRTLLPNEIQALHINPYAMFEDPYPIELFRDAAGQDGWTWGEQNPSPETAIAWSAWKIKETANDARDSGDWGKLQLGSNEEFVSDVKDLGSAVTRYLKTSYDDYAVGSGSGTLYWRGQAATFNYNDNEVAGPTWAVYSPGNKDWRYVQLMAKG